MLRMDTILIEIERIAIDFCWIDKILLRVFYCLLCVFQLNWKVYTQEEKFINFVDRIHHFKLKISLTIRLPTHSGFISSLAIQRYYNYLKFWKRKLWSSSFLFLFFEVSSFSESTLTSLRFCKVFESLERPNGLGLEVGIDCKSGSFQKLSISSTLITYPIKIKFESFFEYEMTFNNDLC
jgi:hypothetical protein